MNAPRLDPASAELALRGLHVRPSAARVAGLCAAARAALDWERILVHVESHGLLGLLARNLAGARVAPPPAARERLAERLRVLEQDDQRFRFTLRRFLAEAAARDVAPILLKGSSLAFDLYDEPCLRAQSDIDVLVGPAEVERAVRAGLAAGLVRGPAALPDWWYRATHFHRKLLPASALLREVEVHWGLVSPALLLTVAERDLRARALDVDRNGTRVRTLEPLDRFLHLVTHLASHARGALGAPEPATLRALLADTSAPLRFKWLVDVHGEWERRAATWTAAEVLARARAWSAEQPLSETLALLEGGLGFEGLAGERWRELCAGLPVPAARPVSTRPRGDVLEGLDFRPSALRGIVPWILPPRTYLERRYGARGAPGLLLARLRHAALALGRLGFAALALPVALIVRAATRSGRSAELRAATAPDRTLDLAVAWRRFLGDDAARPAAQDGRAASLHS